VVSQGYGHRRTRRRAIRVNVTSHVVVRRTTAETAQIRAESGI